MISEPQRLDERGRCPVCRIKAIPYAHPPHFYCGRCDRCYARPSGEQVANWAWFKRGGGFEATYPGTALRRNRDETDAKCGVPK